MASGFQFYITAGGTAYPYLTQGIEEAHSQFEDRDSHTGQASSLLASEGTLAYAGPLTAHCSVNWAALFKDWLVTTRDNSKALVVDTGQGNYRYGYDAMWAGGGEISSTAGENQIIQLSLDLMGQGTAPTYERSEGAHVAVPDMTTNTYSPAPHFCSTIVATGDYTWVTNDVTIWRVRVNNNPITRWKHDGNRVVRHIQPGTIEVEGSVTLFDPNHGPKPQKGDQSQIVIALSQSMTDNGVFAVPTTYLTIPRVRFGTYDDAAAGRNDKRERVVNFFGLGTAANEAIY